MDGFASTLALLLLTSFACLANACGDPKPAPAKEPPPRVQPPEEAPDPQPEPPRRDAWINRQPAYSILLAGNQRGVFKPCGCSEPQLGGLERLATLVQMARKRGGRGFSAVSLGWNLADRGEAQEATKAVLYRAALETMGFDAMLLGTTDLHTPPLVRRFLGGGGTDTPVPPANLPMLGVEPFASWTVRDLSLRALSIVDPDARERLSDVMETDFLPGPLGALQGITPLPETLWLVGTDVTGATMDDLVKAMRRLGPSVIVDLNGVVGTDRVEDVPLEGPLVVSLDVRGKEAGLLDLDPATGGDGWVVSYHAVALDPGMEKIPSRLRPRVTALFDVYRREVKARGYLADFETLPEEHDITYVGSARCARCHPGIYEAWLDTPHAGALRTLQRKDYDWDPECVRCHVVGFERFPDGRWSRVAGGFADPKATPHLGGVGCECCHGPGEAHVESPRDRSLFADGGPNRRHPGRRGCAVCHDVENSFGFQEGYETEFLPRVDHRGVPSDRRYVEPAED